MGARQDVLDRSKLEKAAEFYREFMSALGLPITKDSAKTPERVAKFFLEEFCSHDQKPPEVALFDAKGYDQYVVESHIPFVSMCDHHHLLFDGEMFVGYHPGKYLAGLSKIPRVIAHFAARPQIQEHLVRSVAEYLFAELKPKALMVIAKGRHSCVSCRGIKAHSALTTTSAVMEGEGLDKAEMMRLMEL